MQILLLLESSSVSEQTVSDILVDSFAEKLRCVFVLQPRNSATYVEFIDLLS